MAINTIGRYKLGEVLGQGGMGVVYRSFHPQLNRPVAVKVIRSNVTDPQARQRFMREAQIVTGLAHPHIIRILDIDVQDSQPYIVMDFVEGQSLDKRLSAGALPLDVVLQITLPLTNALGYAHSQGVIHRDLKPANVLLRPDGSPVLADFGIARPLHTHTSAQLTTTGDLIGTLTYIAPEQFLGTNADQRSDIYALGVLLFEMLTGRPPFDGDIAQVMYGHLHQPPPSLSTLQPDLPADLDQLVQRMLAKEPDDRPQTAEEVGNTLLSINDTLAFIGPTVVLTSPSALPIETIALPAMTTADQVSASPVTPPPKRLWTSLHSYLLTGLGIFTLAVILLVLIIPFRGTITTNETTYNLRDALPFQPSDQEETNFPEDRLQRQMTSTLHNEQQVGPERFTVGNMSYGYIGESLWFFGEVRNDGETPREWVEVRISLLNEDGQELASDTGFTSMSYLNSGEISSFQVLFFEEKLPETRPTSYVMEVRSDEADFELGYTVRDITIVDEPQELRERSQIILRGSVYNEAEGPTQFINVKAIFYDTDGAVVGIGDTYAEIDTADDILPSGKNGSFDMRSIIFTGVPTSYRLLVEGSPVRE